MTVNLPLFAEFNAYAVMSVACPAKFPLVNTIRRPSKLSVIVCVISDVSKVVLPNAVEGADGV